MPVIIDMTDGVPLDGYYIDELPVAKPEPAKPKKLRELELDLPLQEHEWSHPENGKAN